MTGYRMYNRCLIPDNYIDFPLLFALSILAMMPPQRPKQYVKGRLSEEKTAGNPLILQLR